MLPSYLRIAAITVIMLSVRTYVQLMRELFPASDVLFASPPCQEWSSVRSSLLPTRCDAEVGRIICRYIEVMQPHFVFVENVRGYAKSKSLQAIKDTLYNEGYWFDVAFVDAAHFGVPQHP